MRSAQALATIDWSRPWLDPHRERGQAVGDPLDPLNQCALHERCNRLGSPGCTVSGWPVRFASQAALPAATDYERHIHATGQVPTRDEAHDLFNALTWFAYPKTKAQLNALQVNALQVAGLEASTDSRSTRGPMRDAATLFDENALLLVTRDTGLAEALRRHAWHELFVERRPQWHRDVGVRVFGHGLLERLLRPYKSITAHVWHVPLDPQADAAAVDAAVAAALLQASTDAEFAPRAFMALPVLGIPGWWADNGGLHPSPSFYADREVFRPARQTLVNRAPAE